jgi:hypothetical protein
VSKTISNIGPRYFPRGQSINHSLWFGRKALWFQNCLLLRKISIAKPHPTAYHIIAAMQSEEISFH